MDSGNQVFRPIYRKITSEALRLWSEEHFSGPMIASVFGVSRVAVYKYLRNNGIDTSKGRVWRMSCEVCGVEFEVSRKVFRNERRRFCSRGCYWAYVRMPDGNVSRTGGRRARAIVRVFFDLQSSHVVHHIDGNQGNNYVGNLMVFAHQTDHLRYHRVRDSEKPKPIWDGSVAFG